VQVFAGDAPYLLLRGEVPDLRDGLLRHGVAARRCDTFPGLGRHLRPGGRAGPARSDALDPCAGVPSRRGRAPAWTGHPRRPRPSVGGCAGDCGSRPPRRTCCWLPGEPREPVPPPPGPRPGRGRRPAGGRRRPGPARHGRQHGDVLPPARRRRHRLRRERGGRGGPGVRGGARSQAARRAPAGVGGEPASSWRLVRVTRSWRSTSGR
jgi:hypothetical protein